MGPLSAPLFGITHDIALPFGCRTSGAACVRVMSAITWIISRRGLHALLYMDDLVRCKASYLDVQGAFDGLVESAGSSASASPPRGASLPPSMWYGSGCTSTLLSPCGVRRPFSWQRMGHRHLGFSQPHSSRSVATVSPHGSASS